MTPSTKEFSAALVQRAEASMQLKAEPGKNNQEVQQTQDQSDRYTKDEPGQAEALRPEAQTIDIFFLYRDSKNV